jgi:hypothetical protein
MRTGRYVGANDPSGNAKKAGSMFLILQVASVFLAALAMCLSLAHALELPGKLRLDKEAYFAVQAIYYPGFTFGGVGEVLALVVAFALLLTTPVDGAAFPLTLVGFVALAAMHGAYWVFTHPVNRFWLKDKELSGLGTAFFGLDRKERRRDEGNSQQDLWKRFRDRWEYSHVLRAALSAIAVIALTTAAAV